YICLSLSRRGLEYGRTLLKAVNYSPFSSQPHVTRRGPRQEIRSTGVQLFTTPEPLAARMRPRTLREFIGQEHILGPGRLLRRAIEADQLSSLIFYGPPGTGKTTLAMAIANTTRSHFITINAVLAGVADIRHAISDARKRQEAMQQRTILFVDEVH